MYIPGCTYQGGVLGTWVKVSVAYFIMEVDKSLSKAPLRFKSSLAKPGWNMHLVLQDKMRVDEMRWDGMGYEMGWDRMGSDGIGSDQIRSDQIR